MLMSSEKDIVDSISNERILNRFADSSSSLRKHHSAFLDLTIPVRERDYFMTYFRRLSP